MGTDELFTYIEKHGITLDSHYDDILGQHSKKAWRKFVTPSNAHLVNDEALDLLSKMLVYDHTLRTTPREAMEHPYFKPVKEHHAKMGTMTTTGK